MGVATGSLECVEQLRVGGSLGNRVVAFRKVGKLPPASEVWLLFLRYCLQWISLYRPGPGPRLGPGRCERRRIMASRNTRFPYKRGHSLAVKLIVCGTLVDFPTPGLLFKRQPSSFTVLVFRSYCWISVRRTIHWRCLD